MTLKTAKKRIKQLERDVIDLQFRFANLEENLAKDLRILFTRTELPTGALQQYVGDLSANRNIPHDSNQ